MNSALHGFMPMTIALLAPTTATPPGGAYMYATILHATPIDML